MGQIEDPHLGQSTCFDAGKLVLVSAAACCGMSGWTSVLNIIILIIAVTLDFLLLKRFKKKEASKQTFLAFSYLQLTFHCL